MTAGIDTTAERMAMLPGDVPQDAVIVIRNLKREYVMGAETVRALRGVDLTIRRNEFVAIMSKDASRDYAASLNKLKGLKGTEFDVAFVAREIDHHTKMLDAVENKFLPAAQNPELKALLTELKPSLQSHLDQARALEKKLALSQ